jgi:CelD/BcsL family acetyltransferase involved in cellulose biosynthesis
MMERLTVEVVRCDAGFAGLRPQWADLHEESEASIFNSWEWLYTWYRRLGSGHSPFILLARDRSSRLRGIWPLARSRRRAMGLPLARLGFLGETHVGSDYLDVVAGPESREEVTRAFAAEILARRGEWDVLDLVDLGERSPTIDILRGLVGPAGLEMGVTEGSVCPYTTFAPGEGFDGYLSRISLGRAFLQRRRWLERQRDFRIEVEGEPRRIPRLLGQLFDLHARRWAPEGGSQGISGPRVEAFHRDATQLLAERGKVRLFVMWIGREALASVYGLVHGRTFSCYQCAYNRDWAKRSVGMVMFGESFRHAVESGLKEYDFLRGEESYKRLWCDRTRRTVSVRIHPRDGAGRLLTVEERSRRRLRRLAKRLLPRGIAGRVKRFLVRRAASAS